MSVAMQLKRPSDIGLISQLYIDGSAEEGEGLAVAVTNPATEEQIALLHEASLTQVDRAVTAARTAFDSGCWGDPSVRSRALERLADVFENHKSRLGGALVQEVGTPVSLIEPLQVGLPIKLLRHYAGAAMVDRTQELGSDGSNNSLSLVRRVPIGVVAAITAYNYPLLLLVNKMAAALAAGCTVVALPSLQAPLATLMVGDLLAEAGFPRGVVNVLLGGAAVGRALTEHAGVDKVTFTGSVAVGRAVMRQAASTIKGVVLELGGKAAAIVLPGAELESVAETCHLRYLRNAGQGCASPTRLLVHESQMARFLDISRVIYAGVKVGDPWDPDTVVGPLISEAHRARVEGYVTRALSAGATIAAGGGRPKLSKGWYMNPTLLAGLDNSFEISREELFGPVGVVLPYRSVDEAVAIANDSDLGLAAAVFGPNEEAMAVAKRLRAGTVQINGGGPIRLDAPMGGFKQSGIGREYGEEGIREFLEIQHIQWAKPPA
jgi:aldehyde dehydrogenase (NAD+)